MSTARQLRLYHRLQFTARTLARVADAALDDAASLSAAQAGVLAVLQAGVAAGGRTQRDLARQLGLAESAVTTMVARLLAAGLVQREPHPSDARAWRLTLTDEGRGRSARAAQAFRAINGALEEALSADELRQLAALLDRVATRFGEPPVDG